MTTRMPAGVKHARCADHVTHDYPKSGWLCIAPGFNGAERAADMRAFADHLAEVARRHRTVVWPAPITYVSDRARYRAESDVEGPTLAECDWSDRVASCQMPVNAPSVAPVVFQAPAKVAKVAPITEPVQAPIADELAETPANLAAIARAKAPADTVGYVNKLGYLHCDECAEPGAVVSEPVNAASLDYSAPCDACGRILGNAPPWSKLPDPEPVRDALEPEPIADVMAAADAVMAEPIAEPEPVQAIELCNACDARPAEPDSPAGYCAECDAAAGAPEPEPIAEHVEPVRRRTFIDYSAPMPDGFTIVDPFGVLAEPAVVEPEPVERPEPAAIEPEPIPAPVELSEPVSIAPAPSLAVVSDGRPTCARCGQVFRKSGSGAEWHRVNRPDCADARPAAIAS